MSRAISETCKAILRRSLRWQGIKAFLFAALFIAPSFASADILQTVKDGASTLLLPANIRYQSLGNGIEGTLASIDISYAADVTFYTVTLRVFIDECVDSGFSDCRTLYETDLPGGWSGVRTIDVPHIAMDPCREYRLRFVTFGLPWGSGYVSFDGSTSDAYSRGSYSESSLADIFFRLHGVDFAPEEAFCADPVVIVPGFMGSFEKNGVWLLDPLLHVYDDLVATFLANGYEKDKTLFEFPYDWRDSNASTSELLKAKIEDIRSVCRCSKVDIVAHSMGGLVARHYIQSDGYRSDVDQIVFLATPHLGAPKAYLTWEGGARSKGIEEYLALRILEQEGEHLGFSDVFDYIRNRPIAALKELLPIYPYKADAETSEMQNYTAEFYPINKFIEDLETTKELLFERSRVLNVVGKSASSTIGKILTVSTQAESDVWEHGKPLNFSSALILVDGDETVPSESAGHLGMDKILNNTHTDMPDESISIVYENLIGRVPDTIIKNPNTVSKKFLFVLVKSPVDIGITAPDGRRIGKDFDNNVEINQIKGSFYSGFDTKDEFILIPDPVDGEYQIFAEGVDGGGGYTIIATYISPEESIETSAIGSVEAGSVQALKVELSSAASAIHISTNSSQGGITATSTIADINESFELGWIYKKQVRDDLIKRIENMIKLDKRLKTVQGKKEERIETKIDKALAKALLVELRAYSGGKMNEQAYNLIKADLEWLISN